MEENGPFTAQSMLTHDGRRPVRRHKGQINGSERGSLTVQCDQVPFCSVSTAKILLQILTSHLVARKVPVCGFLQGCKNNLESLMETLASFCYC